MNGCDSIVNLNLTVGPRIHTIIDTAICYGDTVSFAGVDYFATGTYRDTISAANGCDSTFFIEINVRFGDCHESKTKTICYGDSVVVGTSVYTASGTYADTLTAANGCDSIVQFSSGRRSGDRNKLKRNDLLWR